MSAIPSYLKQIPTDARNFIPVSSLAYPGGINGLNEATATLSTAYWSGTGSGSGQATKDGTKYTSSINGPGAGKLRDMGKTYQSAGRIFRKVQLVVYGLSTYGVAGKDDVSATTDDFLTGYIELGWDGGGAQAPAPVARAP
jgi:hypothetical protein